MRVIDVENFQLVSANERLIPGNGRWINNPKYEKCKDDIAKICRQTRFKAPYCVTIQVGTQKDIDNITKPIFDALKTAGVIDDDRNILAYHVFKTKARNEWLKVDVVSMANEQNNNLKNC